MKFDSILSYSLNAEVWLSCPLKKKRKNIAENIVLREMYTKIESAENFRMGILHLNQWRFPSYV